VLVLNIGNWFWSNYRNMTIYIPYLWHSKPIQKTKRQVKTHRYRKIPCLTAFLWIVDFEIIKPFLSLW
jgi:hypothetical protein